MLYQAYQMQEDLIAPLRFLAQNTRQSALSKLWSFNDGFQSRFFALLEMVTRFKLSHTRPDFAIPFVRVGNRDVPVTVETALDMPFGKLLHFAKDIDTAQPKVLVVAPLSGHFATLLRGTVETLLRDHDVYITDWSNARDVPLSAGAFGIDDYVAYLIRFLEEIGPGSHLLAVCQPCVQALAAVAVMSEDEAPGNAALDDADGRARRSAREPDRGQRVRGQEIARLVREFGHRHRACPLCRRRPPRLSGLPAADRLHGDEHGAPQERAQDASTSIWPPARPPRPRR